MGLKGLREYLTQWRTARTEDRLIGDLPPQPVIIMGADDGADGAPSIASVAGEVNIDGTVVEASALAHYNLDNNYVAPRLINGHPLTATAGGAEPAAAVWVPFVPVTVTADGAGLPPATQIIPLVAALNLDVMIWMQVDTVAGANQYQFDFRTDPLAAVGGISPTDPAWVAVELPLLAGASTPPNTYGHRIMTDTVASAFGIAEGANGDWPNGAQVTFYGFYRAVA